MALAVGAGDLALELAVERQITAEQAGIAVADAVGLDAANGGSLHAWAGGNAQIVVGAERDLLCVLHLEGRARKAVHHQRLVRRTPTEPICQLHKFIHPMPPSPGRHETLFGIDCRGGARATSPECGIWRPVGRLGPGQPDRLPGATNSPPLTPPRHSSAGCSRSVSYGLSNPSPADRFIPILCSFANTNAARRRSKRCRSFR